MARNQNYISPPTPPRQPSQHHPRQYISQAPENISHTGNQAASFHAEPPQKIPAFFRYFP